MGLNTVYKDSVRENAYDSDFHNMSPVRFLKGYALVACDVTH